MHLFIAQDIIKMSRFDIIGGYRLKLIFLFWGAPHSVCVTYFRCLSSGPLNGGMRLGYSTLVLYPTGCQFFFCLLILLVLTQFNMPLLLSLSSNGSTKFKLLQVISGGLGWHVELSISVTTLLIRH